MRTSRFGISHDYDLVVQPQRDAAGQVIGVHCAATDITPRKRAEEAQRFQATVLANIRDSVIVTDLDGTITYWNGGAEEIFGYTAEAMLGRTPALLYPDQDTDRLAADLASIMTGTPHHGEWQGRRHDGSTVWLDIITTSMRDAAGNIVGFVGVGKDVTARKQLERERDTLFALERISRRRLQQFLALVAHDLGQPLTAILGHAQRLQRGQVEPGSARHAHAVQAITTAAEQLQRLVSDLADAAAVGEGQFAMHPSRADLVSIVQEVVAEQQATAQQHRLIVTAPDQLLGIWDGQRLRQLVSNLLSNAIKYSPDGGDIVVIARQDGQDAVLSVSDDGIGIATDQQQHLFDLFSRATDIEHIDGFGLGLFICKAIVNAHAGRISVESEPGRGSTFTMTLPLEPRYMS